MSTMSDDERQAAADWNWDRHRDDGLLTNDVIVEQVGGTHYGSADSLGHWDLMELYDVGYLEGNATKYISRWRRKGKPVEDLEKAISYLQKMGRRPARRLVPCELISQWAIAQDLDQWDQFTITAILGVGYGQPDHIRGAVARLSNKLKEVRSDEPEQP